MTPERRQKVEEMYHAALKRDPDHRAAFLSEAWNPTPNCSRK